MARGAGHWPLLTAAQVSRCICQAAQAAAELALPPPPLVSSPTAAPNYQLLSPSGAINKVQLTSMCVQRPCDGICCCDLCFMRTQRTNVASNRVNCGWRCLIFNQNFLATRYSLRAAEIFKIYQIFVSLNNLFCSDDWWWHKFYQIFVVSNHWFQMI